MSVNSEQEPVCVCVTLTFTWPKPMVIAAAQVKPFMTGNEIKSSRKPTPDAKQVNDVRRLKK